MIELGWMGMKVAADVEIISLLLINGWILNSMSLTTGVTYNMIGMKVASVAECYFVISNDSSTPFF